MNLNFDMRKFKIIFTKFLFRFTDSTLRVVSLKDNQFGLYKCKAVNKLGSAEGSIELFESQSPVCPPSELRLFIIQILNWDFKKKVQRTRLLKLFYYAIDIDTRHQVQNLIYDIYFIMISACSLSLSKQNSKQNSFISFILIYVPNKSSFMSHDIRVARAFLSWNFAVAWCPRRYAYDDEFHEYS